ncbi:TonB-dependent receptor [Danxiaibacter flavus]|uniref:TonB-dependent receptor n=1 Tax=Danxiaibacter flavus TaxID=3049108 RepID=A0ABV3ZDK3_9BACT
MRQSWYQVYDWRRIWSLIIFLTFHTLSFAQTKTVSGTVSGTDGKPLEGVSILVRGTTRGIASDVNGHFSLAVPSDNVTLIVSMSGYKTINVDAKAGEPVSITLAENPKDLDEVVVVGYGKQRKANVIGSVSQINSEQLKQMPTMNVTNALAGRMPGLTTLQQSGRPGADDATLRIRGVGTYGASQGPLIIIDNVQRPSFSNLDPEEIESITILKDAVSTAVYGLQAANGIILITTKRGKTQKATVTYDGGVTLSQNTRFPKFLNGPDYMTWYNKGTDMDNDYLSHTGADPVPYVYTQDQIDAVKNGTNTNPLLGNTDWIGQLIGRNAMSQQHNISVRGGTDKMKYFTSIGMLDQDGVVKNTGFKRYNVRTNLDAELNKVLSVSVDLGARQQLTNTPGISPDNTAYMNPFYQAVRMLPNMPMYAPNGLPTGYYSNAGWVNPIASVDQSGYQNGITDVFQGNVTFNVKIPWVKGLEAKLLTAYDKSSTENKGWLTPYTLMGRQRDQVTGDYVEINTLPGITKTSLRQSYSKYDRKTFQPSITYNGRFGDHSVSALALYEWSQQKSNVFSTGASNFPLKDLQEIDYGSPAAIDQIAPTGSSNIDDSRAGYVVRLNYSYKDKYLLEVASRYDASVNFLPANRWGLFPAAALGWVVSKEKFFDGISTTLNYLKLKGSVGKLGNDVASRFAYMQTYALTSDPVVVIGGKPVSALYTSAPPNVNIHWETSVLTNVGFESVFWRGLLGVDFEWFYKNTKDILDNPGTLYPMSLGGYAPASINYGIVDNRGFDLQVRHRNKIGKINYSVTANVNWAKNKIIRLNESPGLPQWQRRVGRSIGDKMGFIVDGMYQTWDEASNGTSPSNGVVAPGFFKYRDLNGDGRLTREDDMTFVGHSNLPQLMYGLNLDFSYAGFDFSALFQGAAISNVNLAGTYEGSSGTSGIDDNTPFTKTFYGYGNSPYFLVEDSWTPDNPNAKFPRLTAYKASLSSNNAHSNSGWIRDGSYLRLKSVQLGYTLPAKVLSSMKLQQIRFYVSGFNLVTWDKLKYMDPEMPNVNNGFYPQQRLYSAGVNVTF